jgi:hypothetical protein
MSAPQSREPERRPSRRPAGKAGEWFVTVLLIMLATTVIIRY